LASGVPDELLERKVNEKSERLAFVGGGNMAQSMTGGLLATGWSARRIRVADPSSTQRDRLADRFAIATFADNASAVTDADIVVLAVKPQDLPDVARTLRPALAVRRPLVISIAAGIRTTDLGRWLGDVPIVRAMPNRPALLGLGASALYAAPALADRQRDLAAEVMRAVGTVIWLDEEARMDAVTAISGSGPAYFFLLIESLEAAGRALGLDDRIARALSIETAYGAARMARDLEEDPATLRAQVTSQGGTTAAALAILEQAGMRDIVRRAVGAAAARSEELAREYGRR
jgi:pyrroline-5-carboxylate reductase